MAESPRHLPVLLPFSSLVSGTFSGISAASEPEAAQSSMIFKVSAVVASGIMGGWGEGRQS